jgi:hypothetical protein
MTGMPGSESVPLFSHWGGEEFAQAALDYARALQLEVGDSHNYEPLDRLEPSTVMVDFIRQVTKHMPRVKSDLYLCATPADGDNSDNGHWVVELNERPAKLAHAGHLIYTSDGAPQGGTQ